MKFCCICDADASWLYAAPGVTGGQAFCARCLPDHYRPMIGNEVVAAIPPSPAATSPIWEEAVAEEPESAPKKRSSRAKAKAQ